MSSTSTRLNHFTVGWNLAESVCEQKATEIWAQRKGKGHLLADATFSSHTWMRNCYTKIVVAWLKIATSYKKCWTTIFVHTQKYLVCRQVSLPLLINGALCASFLFVTSKMLIFKMPWHLQCENARATQISAEAESCLPV